MKVSNFLHRAWNIAKNGTDKQQLAVIYSCTLIATIIVIVFFKYQITPDTPSYFSAGKVFLDGGIDPLRTPIYSLICIFGEAIYPNQPYFIIFLMQLAVFYISLYYFYRLCNNYLSQKYITFFVSLIYAFAPHYILWTKTILTESLAISITIILCYIVLMSYKTSKIKYSFISFLLLTTLLFLRPIFIFIVPILLLLWLYLFIKERKYIAYTLNILSVLITFALYFGYCKSYEKQYGIFGTSNVSTINQYRILRNHSLADPNVIKDKIIRADVKQTIANSTDSIWCAGELNYLFKTYGNGMVQQYVNDNIKAHLKSYIFISLKRFGKMRGDDTIDVYCGAGSISALYVPTLMILHLFSLSFRELSLFMLFTFGWFVYLGIRQRKMPIYTLFLWITIFANIFTAVVGAPAEQTRLISPINALVLLLFAKVLDTLSAKIKIRDISVL